MTVHRWDRGRSVLLVSVYVNDLIITGAEEKGLEAFKVQMKVSDMSEPATSLYILGNEIRAFGEREPH